MLNYAIIPLATCSKTAFLIEGAIADCDLAQFERIECSEDAIEMADLAPSTLIEQPCLHNSVDIFDDVQAIRLPCANVENFIDKVDLRL